MSRHLIPNASFITTLSCIPGLMAYMSHFSTSKPTDWNAPLQIAAKLLKINTIVNKQHVGAHGLAVCYSHHWQSRIPLFSFPRMQNGRFQKSLFQLIVSQMAGDGLALAPSAGYRIRPSVINLSAFSKLSQINRWWLKFLMTIWGVCEHPDQHCTELLLAFSTGLYEEINHGFLLVWFWWLDLWVPVNLLRCINTSQLLAPRSDRNTVIRGGLLMLLFWIEDVAVSSWHLGHSLFEQAVMHRIAAGLLSLAILPRVGRQK